MREVLFHSTVSSGINLFYNLSVVRRMIVKLIAYTENPDELSAAAAWGCTDHRPSYRILDELDRETAERVLDVVIPAGHHSVIEHASFTFSVEGVSRALTHQLVRHRMASYSQQSQRYIRFDSPEYVLPHTIRHNEEMKRRFEDAMKKAWGSYRELVEAGIPEEDARYVLPNAAKNNITITMNARELIHFFALRCCIRAQWEIRELACRMLVEVKKVAPKIFEKAGASCVALGYCPEPETCGRAPLLKDVLAAYQRGKGE